jgi:hypothetical protein
MPTRRLIRLSQVVCGFTLFTSSLAFGDGSIFVTGHDPDFHAFLGGNAVGAQNIIDDGLTFTRNGNTAPILLLESDTSNVGLGDHTDSEQGLIASGYTAGTTPGNHYVKVNAVTFASLTLADLEQFSSIFIPSDHGGTLTGNDLQALDARSADIISYLNAGGGLFAAAEDGFHQPPTAGPAPALYGFLPFLVSSTAFSQAENGNTLTPAGVALGLANGDINGNFSHNIFTATGGMNVVDHDAAGEVLSLDFRGQIGVTGVAPEPNLVVLIGVLVCVVAFTVHRRKARA